MAFSRLTGSRFAPGCRSCCWLLPFSQPFEILLGILALIARESHFFQCVWFFGQRRPDLLLDRLLRFAGLVRPAGITNPNTLPLLGFSRDARVVEAFIRFRFLALTGTPAFVASVLILS